MLRLLSWNACDRFTAPDMRLFMPNLEASTDVSTQLPGSMKRKRSLDNGNTLVTVPTPVRSSCDQSHSSRTGNPVPATMAPLEGLPTPLLSPKEMKFENSGVSRANVDVPESKVNALRQVIQTQLNLEILLKHKELRLIDQEIAKCQVALEQLRRATEIPYPATQYAEQVSRGRGSAVRSSFSGKLPVSPAPWGVVDGPYSRHYSKWLLEDVRFDGGELESPTTATPGDTPVLGRTRGSFVEHTHYGIKSRSQRGGKLKSLPAGYGQPKEKATGPMILKRKSDNTMVKLVCLDCARHDFGSAQGFINHCRIGHGRNFASHDAAAEACGEPVEYDQNGAVVGVEPVIMPAATSVHPLIRSAKMMQDKTPFAFAKPATQHSGGRKSQTIPSPDFRPSTATPHLSELVKSRGLGLDLQNMVTIAQLKGEPPELDMEESDVEIETPVTEIPRGKHPKVAGTKQLTKPAKAPASSSLLGKRTPTSSQEVQMQRSSDSGQDQLHRQRSSLPLDQLLPASDVHQAPSLIDDDEDFDAHSPATVSGSEDVEEGDVEFAIQDDDDSRPAELARPEFPTTCTQTNRPDSIRRPSALRQEVDNREEKHVSFVASSPDRDVQDVPAGDRKRRKTTKD